MIPRTPPSSTIPMQNLTAPGDWNRQNGALKHFNWSEGCFNFHFIDQDTTDGGPSEWEDYQGKQALPLQVHAGGTALKAFFRHF